MLKFQALPVCGIKTNLDDRYLENTDARLFTSIKV
jgi:hypothetical protein